MGDNQINYNEFIAATIEAVVKIDDEWIWIAFKKFDIDSSGSITL